MHSKIYKAKLMTIQNQLSAHEEKVSRKGSNLGAYFGLLQHVFHRNKNKLRDLRLAGKKFEQAELSLDERPLSLREKSSGRMTTISGRNPEPSKESPQKRTRMNFLRKKEYDIQLRAFQTLKKEHDQSTPFIPIGQASNQSHPQIRLKVRLREDRSKGDREQSQRDKDSALEQSVEKVFKISRPKLNKRKSKSISKVKTEASQETNHSSIRSSKRSSSSQKGLIPSLPRPSQSQAVAPW